MTTMLNRSLQPALQLPKQLHIKTPQNYHLDNGIPVSLFNISEQDVVMLKLVFKAGQWQEPQKLVAQLTNQMLKEGTKYRSAQNLIETIEYYGASLRTANQRNHAEVIIYSLSKHLATLLPLLKEVLTEANFPEDELQTLIRNRQEKLNLSLQKNEVIAGRLFKEKIYGSEHPYGYITQAEHYQNIDPNVLKTFYDSHYTASNCRIYIAGKISEAQLKSINTYLGSHDWLGSQSLNEPHYQSSSYLPETHYLQGPQSAQASIIIGRPLFKHNHPDYLAMRTTNTILGGFFGSRLMRNIREDKGYTYGIYSGVRALLYGGHFYISTDVKASVWEDAVKEIFLEISRLQNEPIPAAELELVKNYLIGSMLSQLDGTFNLASALQNIHLYGLDEQFYHQMLHAIQNIDAAQIQSMAQKYLQKNDLTQIVVGA